MWIKSICAKFNPVKIKFSPLLLMVVLLLLVVLVVLLMALMLLLVVVLVLWFNSWEDQER